MRGRCELSKPIPSAGLPPEGLRLLKVKKLPPNRANWVSRVIYTSLWETCFFGATRISHAIFETSLCKTLLFIWNSNVIEHLVFYQETLLVCYPVLSKRLITWTPGWFQYGRAKTTPGCRRERKDREIMATLEACRTKLPSAIGSLASFHWLKGANCFSSVSVKQGGKAGKRLKTTHTTTAPFPESEFPHQSLQQSCLLCPRPCLSEGRKCGLVCSLESYHCASKPFHFPESQPWVYLNRKTNTHAQNLGLSLKTVDNSLHSIQEY